MKKFVLLAAASLFTAGSAMAEDGSTFYADLASILDSENAVQLENLPATAAGPQSQVERNNWEMHINSIGQE